jgi:hypothetical protein
MTNTEDSFEAHREMVNDVEFFSCITEQIDRILNHERAFRCDDIGKIWRGGIGEIDMFCAMFLGTKNVDKTIH